MNTRLSSFSVELSAETAQRLADFIGNATFETYASCADGKDRTYELRDAAIELLGALKKQGFDYTPLQSRPSLAFIRIPARHISANPAQRAIAIRDVQRAILKSGFVGWAICDFDAGNVEIVDGPDVEIKPIPEL